ncbi:hypothetical protein [Paracoccus sp. (in: a-proteobacteria)]|uniref:hypothetical protein n=1 Tax=Paracoccus sp. TaxID=267 RepID=UPI00272B3CEF|nr:hypothetical protein [Paracoccus sp. (in: a-proteobacteria)]
MKAISKSTLAGAIASFGALLIVISPWVSSLYGGGARLAFVLGLAGVLVAAKVLLRPSAVDSLLMIGAGGVAALFAVITGGAAMWLLLPGAAAILGAGLWLRAADRSTGGNTLGTS